MFSRAWPKAAVVCLTHSVLFKFNPLVPQRANVKVCQDSTASCNFLFFLIIHPGVDSLLHVKLTAAVAGSLLVRFMASDCLKHISPPPCSAHQERNDDE